MNGWKLSFDGKSLDDAQKCEVEILNVEDREIIAKVDGLEVITPIVFYPPHHVFCMMEYVYRSSWTMNCQKYLG